MLKDQRILALDIGASCVKIAEFAALKAGGLQLTNFAVGSLDLDTQSETERIPHIITTIRDLLHERGIKPGPALISVSGQSVFSRFVRLPPVDKEKVYQIILYEAQQNVPFPIEEVVWDYQLIGRGEGELDVMLAAIKADIIIGLTDAVEQAGLTTDLVDVAPMALYNAVRYNYADLKGCTLVIDIGARSTDLIFIEEGRVFIRSVPVAGNAVTQQIMREFELSFQDAEEMKKAHSFVAFGGAYEAPQSEVADKVSKIVRGVMTRMHAEINRSINFYRSQQNGQQPALVLLTGGCSVIPYSDTFLKEKLKVDVDYFNPFINIPVAESIQAEEIGRHAHTLGQVVGLALRKVLTCPIEINLLPKVVNEKEFKRKQPLLVGAMAAVVLILLVWCAFFFKMEHLTGQNLKKVQADVEVLQRVETPLRQAEGEIRSIGEKIDSLLALSRRRTQWLRLLAEIQQALPPELWLSNVHVVRVPVAEPGAAPPAGGAGETGPPGSIVKIELSGFSYIDLDARGDAIRAFRDKLKDCASFAPETEIKRLPSPGAADFRREFMIEARLKQPLAL